MTKRKNSKRNLWIAALVVVIVVLMVVASRMRKGDNLATKVTTEKVTKRTLTEVVSAAGRIFPEIEVAISSDVSGEVVELYVEEGDSVQQGQLLCKVRPDVYQSALERAIASQNSAKAQLANAQSQIKQVEAQYLQMQAQYDNAKAIHDRNDKLLKQGAIAQAEFDNSLAQLRTADANRKSAEANIEAAKQSAEAARFSVKSAEATVQEARTNLNQTSIFAPTGGIISKLNVEQGERVVGTLQMSGTEIMRIANMKYMEVQVDVSENDVLRVKVGDKANIEVDAYLDRVFTGTVMEIANTAQEGAAGGFSADQVTNFTVKIRLDRTSYSDLLGKGGRRYPFRPGMSATVDIQTQTVANVLSLPVPAVTNREVGEDADKELQTVVFLVAADTVALKEVTIGVQDDEHIEITGGLAEGDEVVTGPYQAVARELKAGTKVEVVDKDNLYGRNKKDKK